MRRRFPPATWAAVALALATTAVAVRANTWSTGGADGSGYASQAELWLAGRLTTPIPLAQGAPWPEPEWTFAPLGYRPALATAAMVPTYPPGLPLSLAVVQLVCGRTGIHLLVPALAGLTVWLAFTLGSRLGGGAAGLLAALGVATSPIFLRQATQLMSDVPATAWWTASLALAYRGTARASLGAGLMCAAAVLTRPNLVPAAMVVLALVMARARHASTAAARGGSDARRTAWSMPAAWLVGFVPGCLAVAVVNTVLYGSPLRSGYGSNDELYALTNIVPNLHRYASWLAGTESPLLALAVVGVMARRRGPTRAPEAGRLVPSRDIPSPPGAGLHSNPTWPLLAFVVVIVVAYLPYTVFDDWWYTRFLLPAVPAAFILAAVALTSIASWPGQRWRGAIVSTTAALVAWSSISSARSLGSLSLAANERRYATAAAALPATAASRGVLIAVQHSGSLRYHTGRPTLRWDLLPPDRLEAALTYVRARGGDPFIVLDSTEEAPFKARFAAASPTGGLDWPPSVEVRAPTPVRVYDPAQRAAFMAGARIDTRVVFQPRR